LQEKKKKKNENEGLLRNRLPTLLFKTPTKTEEKISLDNIPSGYATKIAIALTL
jgi:hypothetical protein